MLYRIGEVAEILGLTKEGVRFLERKGLLHAVRSPRNGYRYYTRDELSIVQQIRSYASAGFTLEEAADLVLKRDTDCLSQALRQKEDRLGEEIARLREKQQLLRQQRSVIAAAASLEKGYQIRTMPSLCYLPLEGAYAGRESRVRQLLEKRWMSAVPHVKLAKLPLDRNGAPLDSKGVCADAREARRLGLPMDESVRLLPEGLCLSAYFRKPVGQTREFHALYRIAASLGYTPADDMLTVVLLSTNQDGRRCTVSMVRLPVIPAGTV